MNEKIFIQKQTTIKKEILNKRGYSHLDEELDEKEEENREIEIINKEKRIKIENKEQIIGLDDDEEEIECAFFADPSNLTKKARKKMCQKVIFIFTRMKNIL